MFPTFLLHVLMGGAQAITPSALPVLLIGEPWPDAEQALPEAGVLFAEALGFPWSGSPMSLAAGFDDRANVWRDFQGGVELEVHFGGGFMTLRDHSGYNQFVGEYRDVAPDVAQALEATRDLAGDLDAAGFLSASELDFSRALIDHRRFGMDEGAASLGAGGGASLGPFNADTRITVPRVVSGVQVAGEGIEVVWGAGFTVDMVNLQWRTIEATTEALPVFDDEAAAWERAGVVGGLASNQDVYVHFSDLVYADIDRDADLAWLAPAWLFVYRIDTHLEDGMRVVGKKQILALSAAGEQFELTPAETVDLSRYDTRREDLPEPTPANTEEED